MGRYYNGDIDGKFWFGVQASNDADFFGVKGTYVSDVEGIDYGFDEKHLPKIEMGVETCKKELGKFKVKLDAFFKKHEAYNDEMIRQEFEIPITKVKEILVWYARLDLGKKILKCVKKKESCYFTAEC